MNHDQSDTRATAYLFGELLPEDAVAFERDLERSPQLRREVDALRETIGALKSEFDANSTDVSPVHREAIDQAIHQVSHTSSALAEDKDTPVPPPIVMSRSSEISRRWLLIVGIAASVLLVLGLTYPYVSGPKIGTVANQSDSAGHPVAIGYDQVQSFNGAIKDQRYGDAEEIAKKYANAHPNDPLADTMLQTSALGKRLIENEVALSAVADLDAEIFSDRDPGAEDAQIAAELTDEQRVATNPPQDVALMMSDDLTLQDSPLPAIVEMEELDVGQTPLATNINPLNLVAEATRSKSMAGQAPAATNRQNASRQQGQTPPTESIQDFGFRPQISADAFGGQAAPGQQIASNQATRKSRRSRGRSVANTTDGLDSIGAGGMEMMMGMDNDQDDMMSMDGGMMGMGGMMDMEGMEMEMMDMDEMDMGTAVFGDRFDPIEDNAFVNVSQAPLSTFSIDVDTASYAKVRSMLNRHALPSPDSVRIEELLNYFHYDYPAPKDDHPFAASMEIAACPWNSEHRLARVGIKGREIETDRPSSNIVFLLDVSGSMDEPNKLPLVIDGMKMLTDQLSENDKVAIVVYAGAAGLVLDSTRGDKKQDIVTALERLQAGGSTNGGQGIALAYDIARDNFVVGGTNRVILCSDGDFNVGVTGTDALVALATENAKSNVFLSILGFGTGNHNDAMMERVSNEANGNYAYIDNAAEAKKVLVEELGGTLVTIAKDVKIQIEFNPKEVDAYRLIGYENRILAAEDFNDDTKDAGEIGAGHTVTALYEVVPAAKSKSQEAPDIDELRYQQPAAFSKAANAGEMLALKLRYKEPEGDTSTLIQFPVTDSGKGFQQTDRDFKFAASVAAFGMLLRNSPYSGTATMDRVLNMAREGALGDDYGYRTEFLALVERAQQLSGR